MRAVLKRPNFRLLFAGMFFSMTAESMLLLALAIWAKDLTGSDGMAGATLLAIIAPMALAPAVGFLVDRFRRRPFLVIALFVSAALLSPLLLIRDRGDIWILFAVAVGYGLSYIAVAAALNGLIKEVVPEELLAEANGALQTVKQGLRLIAPLLGAGLYVSTRGWGLAVVTMAGFVLAAITISFLRVPEEAPQPSQPRWISEVWMGVTHLVGNGALRRAVLGTLSIVVVFGFCEPLYFAVVDQGLHRPPEFLALIVSVQGIGGLLGGLTAAPVIRRVGEITTMAISIMMWVPLVVACMFPSLWTIFPAVVLGGAGLPWMIVGFMTLMQRTTPGPIMGRVSAASEALLSGPQAIALALGSVMVERAPYQVLFGIMLVISVFSCVYLWLGRRLSTPAVAEPVVTAPAIP